MQALTELVATAASEIDAAADIAALDAVCRLDFQVNRCSNRLHVIMIKQGV